MTIAPSDWKVWQYTRIESIRTWSLQCSLCGHADGTDSKKAAHRKCSGEVPHLSAPPTLCQCECHVRDRELVAA